MGAIADFINSLGAISQNQAKREGRTLHQNQGREALQDSAGASNLSDTFRNIGLSQLARNVSEQGDISGKGIWQGPDALREAWENPAMIADLYPEVTASAFSRDKGKSQEEKDEEPEQNEAEPEPTNKLKEAADSDEPWNPGSTPDSIKRPPASQRLKDSQLEEWYDFLENTDAGKEIASMHPEYASRDDYGFSRLRGSEDADIIATWIMNDPRAARRFMNSGVDTNDLEHLVDNVREYMWGDNAILLNDYANRQSSYNLGDDNDSIDELGKLLYNVYGYNFKPDMVEANGLDEKDLLAEMYARQIGDYGWGNLDKDAVSSLLSEAGYLDEGSSFRFMDQTNPDYSSYYYDPSKARKYGSTYLDEYSPSGGVFDDREALVASLLEAYNEASPSNLRMVAAGPSEAQKKTAKKISDNDAIASASTPY